jgi:hypothetical protein
MNAPVLKAGVTNGKKLVKRMGMFAMVNKEKALIGLIRRLIGSLRSGLFIELDRVIKV